MRKILFAIFILSNIIVCGQSKVEILDLIKKLPMIDFGVLPYWHGDINNMNSFEHGFYLRDSLDANHFNQLIQSALPEDSLKCFIVNSKNESIVCKSANLILNNNSICRNTKSFQDNDGKVIESIFCPNVYPVAKSIVNQSFYIVYFWKATNTELISYFALIFDFKGNLISYQDLDNCNLGFPYAPYSSIKNKVRELDSENTIAMFLPNKLLFVKYPYNLTGGGAYFVIVIKEDGHFQTCKVWTEEGEIDRSLTEKDKFQNCIRVDENDKKINSLIIYSVYDKDGYSNIREQPDSNAKIIRVINNYDVLFGTLTQNGWCKVEFSADSLGIIKYGGFIHLSRLAKISDKYNEFIQLPLIEKWRTNLHLF